MHLIGVFCDVVSVSVGKLSHWIQIRHVYAAASLLASKRKPSSCRWQTRATRKHAKNCSNSTCLQRCRWEYWSIFMRLAVVASEICEISRNYLKIQTYRVQGHPRSSILVSMESEPCSVLCLFWWSFTQANWCWLWLLHWPCFCWCSGLCRWRCSASTICLCHANDVSFVWWICDWVFGCFQC